MICAGLLQFDRQGEQEHLPLPLKEAYLIMATQFVVIGKNANTEKC